MIKKAKLAIGGYLQNRFSNETELELLRVATALDPRFKSLSWMEEKERDQAYNSLKQEALRFTDENLLPLPVTIKKEPDEPETVAKDLATTTQCTHHPLPSLPSLDTPASSPEPEEPSSKKKKVEAEEEEDGFFDVLFVKTEKTPKTVNAVIDAELNRYKEEPVLAQSGDVLQWWQDRKGSYSNLATVALRYLHIPATSVPSERVFSSAGEVINKKRATLSPDNAEVLIFP